jgi:hypothetical protein
VVPFWYRSGQDAETAGANTHGTFVQPFDPAGTFALQSSTIDIGTIAQSGLGSARYYARSYDIGYSTSNQLTISWIDSATGTSYVVGGTAASSPTDFQSIYIRLDDSLGERGYFRVYFAGGGKIYSLGDNIARQQMTEPF